MSEYCRKCGAQVTDELPGGLCPSCLMVAAQASQKKAVEVSRVGSNFETPSIRELADLFPELEIIELVGQGGMGAVYKARQRDLDRIVALKIFLYRPNDPEFTERFKREARALGQLSHPNIVTVHQFGNRNNMHFLLMEYVDGLNLRQITLEQRLAPAHAMQLVPQLCDAIQFAHDHGVVHRDIKPENILLDARGNIKIADFGLAKLTKAAQDAGLTHTQQVMGTWNYMAPEQKERPTEVDHRADIYSLGVVIYEMLTGELPLGRFPSPSEKAHIDSRIDEIVLRALEKDPGRRYQQASDFKTGFESVGGFEYNNYPAPPVKTNDPNAGYADGATQNHANVYNNQQVSGVGSRLHIAIMGGQEKKGNWQVGSPNIMLTLMGGNTLDLSQVSAKQVNILSFVMMGGVDIIVPDGALVDLDGFILMGATENKVNRSDAPAPMRVRIRSFGLMGGCEVRTPRRSAASIRNPKSPIKTAPAGGWQRGIIFAFQALAMLITLAIPILFLLSSSNLTGSDANDFTLAGIIVAIAAALFWSEIWYLRVLLGVRPRKETPEERDQFDAASKLGALIRGTGLLFLFGCAILFVVHNFEGDSEIRIAAIISGIVGGALFACAEYAEEFFYGEHEN